MLSWLQSLPHASAWSQLFAELRHRLGVAESLADGWCPRCDGASLVEAGRQGGAAAAAYAAVKRCHLDTATICQQQGLTFVPLVAETAGAWDPEAARVLRSIAQAAAAREQSEPAALMADLLQEASVLVRSFCGRAALQQRADAALAEAPSSAAAAAMVVLRS
eukprot:s5209_g2.t1